MAGSVRDDAVAEARSVSAAARALVRALSDPQADTAAAADWLEARAVTALDRPVAGFGPGTEESDSAEDYLARAVAQLDIGLTLVDADIALADPGAVASLTESAGRLETTADALESEGFRGVSSYGFDGRPDGELLSVPEAVEAALDEMSSAAATVLTVVADKVVNPVLDKIPDGWRDVLEGLTADLPGRLVKLGLRAVSKALDTILGLVDVAALASARDSIDTLLARFATGEDTVALAAWSIGAYRVRDDLAAPRATNAGSATDTAVDRLVAAAARFGGICALLRKAAALLTGLGVALTALHVAAVPAQALTVAAFVVLLGCLVVLGREYTGAGDAFGGRPGVKAIALGAAE